MNLYNETLLLIFPLNYNYGKHADRQPKAINKWTILTNTLNSPLSNDKNKQQNLVDAKS